MFKNVNDLIKVMEKHTPVAILGDQQGAMLAITPENGGKVIAMSVDGVNGKNLMKIDLSHGTIQGSILGLYAIFCITTVRHNRLFKFC